MKRVELVMNTTRDETVTGRGDLKALLSVSVVLQFLSFNYEAGDVALLPAHIYLCYEALPPFIAIFFLQSLLWGELRRGSVASRYQSLSPSQARLLDFFFLFF